MLGAVLDIVIWILSGCYSLVINTRRLGSSYNNSTKVGRSVEWNVDTGRTMFDDIEDMI
jgi:hypothetical protein